MNIRTRTVFALTALALTGLVLNAAAKDIPTQLPDPDGKAGDALGRWMVKLMAEKE